MEKLNIYRREKEYENELKRVERANISSKNKEFISKFHNNLLANAVTKERVIKISYQLRYLASLLEKDFDNATKENIMEVVKKFNIRTDLSEATKGDYRRLLKQFYKWLRNDDIPPPEVRWIKNSQKIKNRRLAGQVITPEEVQQLVSKCENIRDKSFLSLVYETGARIGELLNMKVGDFENGKISGKVRLIGKTGERRVTIVSSVAYLNQYLSTHPYREDKNAYFWLCNGTYNHNEPLAYIGAVKLIKNAFRRANINKRCNPHMFRHSRATELASHLTDVQMCLYFGWVLGTGQVRNYVHASGRDVDSGILSYYNIKEETNRNKAIDIPINCSRCNTVNGSTAKFCCNCGMALDLKTALDTEEKIKVETEKAFELLIEIAKDPKLMEEFEEFKENLKNEPTRKEVTA